MVRESLVRRERRTPRRRVLRVTRIEELGPAMRRIWLGGDDLEADFAFTPLGASDHIKLVPPDPETGQVVLPPPDGPRPTMRDYTVRRFDAERKELALDFVLHDHGPAGRWGIGAVPGSQVGVLGPRGSQIFPGDVEQYLIVVDETGLPAAERFLEELPAAVAVRLIVLGGSRRVLANSARDAEIIWVNDFEEAAPLIKRPPADVFGWAAGEAEMMRGLRVHLRDELGVDPARVSIHGYWRVGHAGSLPREEEV